MELVASSGYFENSLNYPSFFDQKESILANSSSIFDPVLVEIGIIPSSLKDWNYGQLRFGVYISMVEKDFYIFKINPTTITGVSREEF